MGRPFPLGLIGTAGVPQIKGDGFCVHLPVRPPQPGERASMEPASAPATGEARPGRKGSLENPEVYENVPGHVIPILEREFDDFDTEAEKFLDGETPEDEFIGFRLKQGVYGQRQPDVQMIRVKLPFGGVTPEQMDAFADVIETLRAAAARATSPRARTSRSTTSRCATMAEADPRDLRRRPLQPRGLRQHRPQRHRRPVGRRRATTRSSTPRRTPAPTCATSSATRRRS